jgi:hypothetical protein
MTEIVSIDGKSYAVKFGFNALRLFGNETGKSLAEIMTLSNNIGMNDAIALMWAGLKDGHRVEKTPFVMTMDDVSDLLDADPSALNKVMDVFAKSFKAPESGNVQTQPTATP